MSLHVVVVVRCSLAEVSVPTCPATVPTASLGAIPTASVGSCARVCANTPLPSQLQLYLAAAIRAGMQTLTMTMAPPPRTGGWQVTGGVLALGGILALVVHVTVLVYGNSDGGPPLRLRSTLPAGGVLPSRSRTG